MGLAVGDALGAAVEFSSPGSFAPVTDYRSGGPHGLKAGEWTDDASMALALADSMASAGWDLNDQARRYVEWWQAGKYSVNGRCFDIGITTRSALSRFVAGQDALASGDASERASGNGPRSPKRNENAPGLVIRVRLHERLAVGKATQEEKSVAPCGLPLEQKSL
jgi:ADP-ribosyl-[dinitrogen reductase] hydrolase